MAARGFTTNSLGAGGRWGQPAAATGVEFDDYGNVKLKKEEEPLLTRYPDPDPSKPLFENERPSYMPKGNRSSQLRVQGRTAGASSRRKPSARR